MRPSREEMQQRALDRATNGQTLSNFPAIFLGFMAKGIPECEIQPRENVLTYHAWRALGRQVRRGEHGVKVCTYVTCEGKRDESEPAGDEAEPNQAKRGYRRPWTATVFHISQTDPVKA
jgi:antirestriction protein ArdC